MSKKTKTLFKITICCIFGWAFLIFCLETGNTQAIPTVAILITMIILIFVLFDKLNKIIELLRKIADK